LIKLGGVPLRGILMVDSSYKSKLDRNIWRTKGARFNACRRLLKNQKVFTFVTASSSIHLLSINILQLSDLITLSENQSEWLSFISIILSIIILAYSLAVSGEEYGLKSEKYHSCGIELDKVYTQLQLIGSNPDELMNVTNQYHQCLEKYMLNHDVVDDDYFQTQHVHEFVGMKNRGCLGRFKIKYSYGFSNLTYGLLFVIIPLLISFKVIFP
jgi:hypothetical protein